ncbi:unnamed protein product [Hermetia illucens]|uniref:Uncharacterized protein n=1 Tax=Hermetia illucens TaxID=343691 RepID=A0A7R8UCJ2_HERIL|nr:uncharacterized protein LOC119646200 [Hermetia illucens]CAD7078188.1 unnamed protein product [Hermetia illucens]
MAFVSDLVISPNVIPWSLVPAVFVGLWALIFIDFKNFMGSKVAYTVFTAKDPINCYQDYKSSDSKAE